METKLYSSEQVEELIKSGKTVLLAGDEKVLSTLPKGNWVGGTIPYFMDSDGGKFTQDKIYVTELPDYIEGVESSVYSTSTIKEVYNEDPENGFSVIILPAGSDIHSEFSINSHEYENFATKPLVGWVSGVDLDSLGSINAKVFDGKTGKAYEDKAVVVHATLPETKHAEIDIVNIFEPGDGDVLTFLGNGFSAEEVLVNGEKKKFADYLQANNIDTKLPLVADSFGAMINTSFQSVEDGVVNFYAPVFTDTEYKIAKPFVNYVKEFDTQIPEGAGDKTVFSCNCILNYLYADLEGKPTIGFTGPVTFGEVAYQLLNQTMVYLTIESV